MRAGWPAVALPWRLFGTSGGGGAAAWARDGRVLQACVIETGEGLASLVAARVSPTWRRAGRRPCTFAANLRLDGGLASSPSTASARSSGRARLERRTRNSARSTWRTTGRARSAARGGKRGTADVNCRSTSCPGQGRRARRVQRCHRPNHRAERGEAHPPVRVGQTTARRQGGVGRRPFAANTPWRGGRYARRDGRRASRRLRRMLAASERPCVAAVWRAARAELLLYH